MKYPKFLTNNNTIAIPAPSSGLNFRTTALYENAVKKLKEKNHTVLESPNRYNNDNSVSADPKSRAKEFSDFWCNDNVDFLLSLAGGEYMVEILPHLSVETLKKYEPKLFQGFSDNTTLNYFLAVWLDTASVYHYNSSYYGIEDWDKSLVDSMKFLKGQKLSFDSFTEYQSTRSFDPENPLKGFNIDTKSKWKILHKGKSENEILLKNDENMQKNSKKQSNNAEKLINGSFVEINNNLEVLENKQKSQETVLSLKQQNGTEITFSGRIIGGCLDILTVISGTKYDNIKNFIDKYKSDGIIWYLESCDINTPETLRALWQLKETGWFEHVNGFIFGRPLIDEDYNGMTLNDSILSQLKEFDVPIIIDADIGHVLPTIPVLNGSVATVVINDKTANITYSLI